MLYSDGTLVGGEGKGTILDGTPGKDAYYTGYHWTKAVCETCGTTGSNGGIDGYGFNKNVYNLYDCAAEFTEHLPETVAYEYTDSRYHTASSIPVPIAAQTTRSEARGDACGQSG